MSDIVRVEEATRETDDTASLYVVFRVADADYALPADVVVQMEEYTGASAVPGSPRFVVGVMQVRGKVVPVVDLRLRFGLPGRAEAAAEEPQATKVHAGARVVVGELADRRVALMVDSAREVMRFRPSQLKPPPKLLEGDAGGFIRSVVNLEARLILVLDFAKLIGHEEEPADEH